MSRSVFDTFHPAIAIAYFVAVLVFTMAAFHPVYLLAALAASLLCNARFSGWRQASGSLAWQLPLLLIVTIANPLFSASGSTVLLTIFGQPLYAESLTWGACMGVMLVSVMQWFAAASRVVTSDKLMAVTGRVAPVTTLMAIMTGRLVPQFVRQGRAIDNAQKANAITRNQNPLARNLRTVTTLMGWTLEDSLESADSMRARGWDSARKRTCYRRIRFSTRDGIALAALTTLVVLSAIGAILTCSSFGLYPTLHGVILSTGMIPYALLLAFPLFLHATDALAEKQAKNRQNKMSGFSHSTVSAKPSEPSLRICPTTSRFDVQDAKTVRFSTAAASITANAIKTGGKGLK